MLGPLFLSERWLHSAKRCATRLLAHRARLRSDDQRAQNLWRNCFIREIDDAWSAPLECVNHRVVALENKCPGWIAIDIKSHGAVCVQRCFHSRDQPRHLARLVDKPGGIADGITVRRKRALAVPTLAQAAIARNLTCERLRCPILANRERRTFGDCSRNTRSADLRTLRCGPGERPQQTAPALNGRPSSRVRFSSGYEGRPVHIRHRRAQNGRGCRGGSQRQVSRNQGYALRSFVGDSP
jgi:hypothetical protein